MDPTRAKKLFLAFVVVVGFTRLMAMLPSRSEANDFAVHYLSSRLLIEGQMPYGVPLEPLYQEHGFEYDPIIHGATNPPTLMRFFGLFCHMGPSAGFWSWTLLQISSLGVVLWVTRHFVLKDQPLALWLLAALTVFSVPIAWHFVYGQVQLFLSALVLGGFYLSQRGRHTAGCLLVAFAGVLKLFPLVLLPWFLLQGQDSVGTKTKRAVLILGATLVAVIAAGPTMWLEFREHALPIISDMTGALTHNFSVPALFCKLYWATHATDPPTSVRLVGTAIGLSIIGAAYLMCWVGRSRQSAVTQLSLLIVAMIAGGMTAWVHYFVFLILPLAVLAKHSAQSSSVERILVAVSSVLIITCWHPPLPSDSRLLQVLLMCFPVYATMVLYGLLAKKFWSRGDAARTEVTSTVGAGSALRAT